MAISFKARLYVGFTLAILISAANGISSYLIFQKQAKQRQWVRRTHHVIDTANVIQKLMVDMETGRRGFRATNENRFLEPYNMAKEHLDPALSSLKDSLSDNAAEEKRVSMLVAHVDSLRNFWINNGDDAGKYSKEYITAVTDTEKKQMDAIRGIIATIVKDENSLFTARRDEYEKLIHDSAISSSIGNILSEVIIVILIFFIFREFRRRRRIQEQLNKSVGKLEEQTNELKASEEDLKHALKEVADINKQLEKFVYTVAHDIKSPLAGISGALSILEEDKTIIADPSLSEFVRLSNERVVHLSEMVNSILEYSRVALDKQQMEIVNTKTLVEEITTLMFPPKNIQVVIASEMPIFKTKRIKIMEVFQNLISNSIKYSNKKEGLIEIGCRDKEEFYEFYVKDNGLGIAAENIPHLFSLFRDAHNMKLRESSTGFGLNIVKLIIEEQGGKIWVDSEPGKGSTFYFEWKK